MDWERARTPEQQEERRQEILDAAATLFRQMNYETVSLNAIADEAGFTKSNIYRYFASREEIFLTLFLVDFSEWADGFIETLRGLPPETTADHLVEIWVDSLYVEERMLDLIPLLALALERNVSEDALFQFKLNAHQMMGHIVEALATPLPMMTPEQGAVLFKRIHGLIAGLWPFANPNEVMQRVMERPELAQPPFDFRATLKDAIAVFVRDIQGEIPHAHKKAS